MSEQNKQLLKSMWDAVADGDWAALGKGYGENVKYHGTEELSGLLPRAARMAARRVIRQMSISEESPEGRK